jgi:hypothetical protein
MQTRGKVEGEYWIPQANFKTLANKNAIKLETGGPAWQCFLKALTRNFGKNLSYPLPWIFNPSASLFDPILFNIYDVS